MSYPQTWEEALLGQRIEKLDVVKFAYRSGDGNRQALVLLLSNKKRMLVPLGPRGHKPGKWTQSDIDDDELKRFAGTHAPTLRK